VATELGHAFAHAGNAHAKARDIGLGWAVGGKLHAATVIDDLQGDRGRVFAETDGRRVAAGMALDVGEAFLNDAEEGYFNELRQAAELFGKDKFGLNAAAFAETADIFLERGDKAEFIEQRRMQEIGESADFAGHLLQKGTGFFEGAFGGFAEGGRRLMNLGQAQVYGQNGLRHAIVELAADAAALFVLQFEQLHRELTDGLLGIFHLGDIGEGRDDTEDGAVGIELRDGIAENPKNFRYTRATPSHRAIANRPLRANHGSHRTISQGHIAALLIHGDHAGCGNVAANRREVGNPEHFEGGLIGEFDFAIRGVQDNANVEIADQSAETLFAFPESIESFALLGDVGSRSEDTCEIPCGVEFRNHIRKSPKNLIGVGKMPTEHLAIEGPSGGDNGEERSGSIWNGSAVLLQRLHADFLGNLMQDVVELESKHFQGSLIGELQPGLRIEGDHADMKALNEETEALFAGAEKFFGGLAFGDVADHNQGAAPAVEIEKGAGHLPGADLAGLGAEAKLPFVKFAGLHKLREQLGAAGGIFPNIHLGGRFVKDFRARVAR